MGVNNNKVVYITGGSSGIGLALAKSFAKQGADLVLLARSETKLLAAKNELTPLLFGDQKVAIQSVDVGDYSALSASMDQLCENYGAPDLLITSAGTGVAKEFTDTSREEADSIMQINYAGTRDAIQCLLPKMITRGSGQIMLVASMASLLGTYGYTAYCASKHALMGFASSLRAEVASQNIQISMLCPPEVDTPILELEKGNIPAPTRRIKDLAGRLQADDVARYAIKELKKGKFLIIPGIRARLTYGLSRWVPGVLTAFVDWITRQSLRKTVAQEST